MSDRVSITGIEFYNFKAFSRYSVKLSHLDILVGPNNTGKSTILSAFRVLSVGIRRARSKKPESVYGYNGACKGYALSSDTLPISVENVHTDYSETDTEVIFKLSNGNQLALFFPKEGGCNLIPKNRYISSPSQFTKEYPITVGVIPVLGPVEHHEELKTEDTIRQHLLSHRASRHFRSYWYRNPAGFDEFAQLLSATWPGMEIELPQRSDPLGSQLSMFCRENRMSRELFWCGTGFQTWCQLLTHLSRSRSETLLVIDEPEIYLHPDVQRQLLGILRNTGPDILLATHSTEIMSEADPSDILLIDKSKRVAERLKDVKGVQEALYAVGSVQNITLTQLARNKRVLFVEDIDDFRTLRRFARRLGLTELSAGIGITPLKSEGVTSLDKVRSLAWGVGKIGGELSIGTIFDRDYRCVEEIDQLLGEMKKELQFAYFHDRKEIENYLLAPSVIDRVIQRNLADKRYRSELTTVQIEPSAIILERITDSMRTDIQGHYIAERIRFFERSPLDRSTVTSETIRRFDEKWNNIDSRMEIVPGKEVLRKLRTYLQDRYGFGLSDSQIIEAFRREEISSDLCFLLHELENYRKGDVVGYSDSQ